MTLYSADSEWVQLAKETTPGSAGSSFLIMPNTTIEIAGAGDDAEEFIGSGGNYVNDVSNRRERGEGTYTGGPSFDEDVLIFDSVFQKATPTGTTAKVRDYWPVPRGADTYQSYTAQRGQAGAAEQFLFMLFNSFSLAVNDGGATKSGDLIAQLAAPQATMTASPTTLPSTPSGSVNWELFWDTSMTALDSESNKVLTGFDWASTYGPKFAGYTPINKSQPSWTGVAQRRPMPTLTLITGFDVSGSDYAGPLTLAKKRAGTLICWRLKGTGAIITGSTPYTYIVDIATKIRNVPGRARIQDVLMGQSWPLVAATDPAANAGVGAAIHARLINTTA
jgi:hypothetical protein